MGKNTFADHWLTIVLLVLLGLFGLFLLISVTPALFYQQLAYFIAAIIIIVILVRIDWTLLWWLAPFGYVLSILLILASYGGPIIRGATRWIIVANIQLQPAELVKPLLLVAFSRFLVQFSPRRPANLALHLVLFFVPFLLIFKQPDLGTGLIYFCAWLAMLWAAGLPMLIPLFALPILFLVTPVAWRMLATYQQSRILTFLYPGSDPTGAGYNALQAVIAVGSGQWFGRGLGFGTQSHLRFLPEYHTDFIFAALIEEVGFFGGLVLLVVYALLLRQIILPLVRGKVKDAFAYIYSVGLFTLLLSQIFINAGMNMGLLPITGITLPFISYGGSSILALAIAFSLLWILSKKETGSSEIEIS